MSARPPFFDKLTKVTQSSPCGRSKAHQELPARPHPRRMIALYSGSSRFPPEYPACWKYVKPLSGRGLYQLLHEPTCQETFPVMGREVGLLSNRLGSRSTTSPPKSPSRVYTEIER